MPLEEFLASYSVGHNGDGFADFCDTDDPPTADAGQSQSIRAGDTAYLDGSDSFDDNTASEVLEYSWNFFSKPEGSTAVLVDADTALPNFLANEAGTYVVELVVSDESGHSSTPSQVVVSTDNLAPTAVIEAVVLVIIPDEVVLDGRDSTDEENDPLSFEWAITSAPAGSTATISDSSMDTAGLTPDEEGVYEVSLTVSDFLGPGTPKTVTITATTAQNFPIFLAAQHVADLSPSEVTTGGNQNAFQNFMTQAIVALQAGDVAEAINKLEKAIARTDGCAERGSPDGNGKGRDWITSCPAQTEAYNLLNSALEALLSSS